MTAKTLPDPERHERGGWRVPPNAGRRYPAEILAPEEVQALLRSPVGARPEQARSSAWTSSGTRTSAGYRRPALGGTRQPPPSWRSGSG